MSLIKTPDTSHLTEKDFDNVYEPAEDSYILLDALETEIEEIRRLKPTVALEVGPGSGIISAALANLTLNHNSNKKLCFVFSCDVNFAACNATKRTAVQNNIPGNLEVIRCNLMDSIRDRLHQNIDLIVCNPPYVVTTNEELNYVKSSVSHDIGIEAAWAGGIDGCSSVTNSLIQALPEILSSQGVCYLVVEHSNKPDLLKEFAESLGLNTSIVLQRRAGREFLMVMKISKSDKK